MYRPVSTEQDDCSPSQKENASDHECAGKSAGGSDDVPGHDGRSDTERIASSDEQADGSTIATAIRQKVGNHCNVHRHGGSNTSQRHAEQGDDYPN